MTQKLPLSTTVIMAVSSLCLGQADVGVTKWVKQNAVELKTVEAGNGFQDMQAIKAMIGSARVVGLGESTHGTREFFQLKHRMVEFLVEEMDFTIFGIEASYPDCIAINDFVLHGKGDPAEALRGQGFWTWDTQEVFEMIKWMRAYNADGAHTKKLLFYGYDMQNFGSAADVALHALGAFEPSKASKMRSQFAPLLVPDLWKSRDNIKQQTWKVMSHAVNDLVGAIETHRDELVAKDGQAQYETFHHHAIVARQCLEMHSRRFTRPGSNKNWRDIAMAENIRWIADRHPDERLIVWAHNGHISKFGPSMGGQTMGSELDRAFGSAYVNFGFAFCQGTFQAVMAYQAGEKPDGKPGLRMHHASMAARGSVGRTFAHTGIPIFALDLRTAPKTDRIRKWFASPQPMRSVGSMYDARKADSYFTRTALLDHFDCMLFVESTTSAVPMPKRR